MPGGQAAGIPTSGPTKPTEGHNEDPRGPGAPPADQGWLSFGKPLGHASSHMAWLDGRYGDNPNRMQKHHQYQVILKPDPGNPQEHCQ